MYIQYSDLFFSQIYENESGRKSFRPKTLIYRVSRVSKRHTPSPMSLEGLCISYYFFFRFFISKFRLMNELQEKLFLQIEMCLLLKVHIKGMYIHTYIHW